jgi:hypothetical protein
MIAQGDALIKAGMAAAGYVYVNIDDWWDTAQPPDCPKPALTASRC